MRPTTRMQGPTGYEVRFRSLLGAGPELAFPCDADGHVVMDDLTDRQRHYYLYARAVVGYQFARPEVRSSDVH